MESIGSELAQKNKLIKKLQGKIKTNVVEIDLLVQYITSLENRLKTEIRINQNYRDFFYAKGEYCNWLRDHNAQFQAFKASPYYIKPTPDKLIN